MQLKKHFFKNRIEQLSPLYALVTHCGGQQHRITLIYLDQLEFYVNWIYLLCSFLLCKKYLHLKMELKQPDSNIGVTLSVGVDLACCKHQQQVQCSSIFVNVCVSYDEVTRHVSIITQSSPPRPLFLFNYILSPHPLHLQSD